MKFVKKTISLEEDVFKYAKQLATQLSKEQARKVGVSNVISNLLLTAKRRQDQKQAA